MTSENLPTILSIICTVVVALAPYVHAHLERKHAEREFHRKRKFEILESFSSGIDAYAGSAVMIHLRNTINLMYLYCDDSCRTMLDEISACVDAGENDRAYTVARELISSIDLHRGGSRFTCRRRSRRQGKQ